MPGDELLFRFAHIIFPFCGLTPYCDSEGTAEYGGLPSPYGIGSYLAHDLSQPIRGLA